MTKLCVATCLRVKKCAEVIKSSPSFKHNRLNVGRIALERLVGALNELQPASVGGGGGGSF